MSNAHETSQAGTAGEEPTGKRTAGEFRKFTSKLRANGAQLEDELRDAGERLSEGAKKFSEAAAEQIREHPLASFGVAFAAGVVLSRLLRSSR